jgi:hypothetical protein
MPHTAAVDKLDNGIHAGAIAAYRPYRLLAALTADCQSRRIHIVDWVVASVFVLVPALEVEGVVGGVD